MTTLSHYPCPVCGAQGYDGHPQAGSARSFCGSCGCQYTVDPPRGATGHIVFASGGRQGPAPQRPQRAPNRHARRRAVALSGSHA